MPNIERQLLRTTAVFAAVCAVLFTSRESSAQTRRFPFFPPQRTASNTPNNPTSDQQHSKTPGYNTGHPAPNLSTDPAPTIQFEELLEKAIQVTSKRYLTADAHSPWQIFHYLLATRRECQLKLKGSTEKVNALDWISTTEPKFGKESWMMLTPHGAKFHPYTQKYFFEGHPAQFMALMTHCDLPQDHEFRVEGKTVKLSDFINNIKKEVNTREEVTWVLWTLQHYLPTDAEWVNQANERWSIERLVQMETAAPVVGAPCGGNHRLFALTRARDKHLASGGRLSGTWLQADQKIRQHIEIAKSLQNSDGSFSSASYEGPMHSNDVNQRFNTTGHTMEFLSIALPEKRLTEPWVRNAVWMLSRELVLHRDTKIDCGPLFHTLDALILYRDRLHASRPPIEQGPNLADSTAPKPPAEKLNPSASALPGTNGSPAPAAKTAPKSTDTVKLPENGALAPSTKSLHPRPAPHIIAKKDSLPKGEPGLLPDQSATPLAEPLPAEPPIREQGTDDGDAGGPGSGASHEQRVSPLDIDDDLVSALEPANNP